MTPADEAMRAAAAAMLGSITDYRGIRHTIDDMTEEGAAELANEAMAAALRALDAAGYMLVPKEASGVVTRAMAESQAADDEGVFDALGDLIGFSGENKTHTVLREAYRAGVLAAHLEMAKEYHAAAPRLTGNADDA